MIHFAVAAGHPAAVEHARQAMESSIERNRVFDGERRDAVASDGRWALVSISSPDPLMADRLLVRGDSMAALNGAVLGATWGQENLLESLLAKLRAHGSAALGSDMGGGWNFLGIVEERGLCAFGDFSGQYPLYFGDAGSATVVSNRSKVVSEAVGPGGLDLRAMSWLVGQGLRGDQMPSAGAKYLRPGTEIRVSLEDGSHEIARSSQWIWSDPRSVELREKLTSAEWDEVTDDLVKNFAAIGGLRDRPVLRLTGGKDSRLSLALAKAAGITGDLLTMTTGAENSPEVECAAEVARVAGVEHRRVGPPTPSSVDESALASFDTGAVWRRLRQHTYRYESIVSPWDGMNDRLARTSVNFTGFGGEIYKRGSDGRLNKPVIVDPESFAAACNRGFDPLGARRPPIAQFQDESLRRWIDSSLDEVHFDSLAEKWYIDYRLGHWNGALAQSKPGHITLTPLVSRIAAQKQMQLATSARTSQRLIFEVMRRVSPDLAALPFLNDTWSPDVIADSPIEVAQSPFPSTHPATRFTLLAWQNQFVNLEADTIRDLIDEANNHTDFGLMLDADKLKNALSMESDLSVPKLRQLITVVGIAIALLGRAERVVDHCD